MASVPNAVAVLWVLRREGPGAPHGLGKAVSTVLVLDKCLR